MVYCAWVVAGKAGVLLDILVTFGWCVAILSSDYC